MDATENVMATILEVLPELVGSGSNLDKLITDLNEFVVRAARVKTDLKNSPTPKQIADLKNLRSKLIERLASLLNFHRPISFERAKRAAEAAWEACDARP